MPASFETQVDHAATARLYAAGAVDALTVASAFRRHDTRRTGETLDEAIEGLREALAHTVAARAAFKAIGNAMVALALIAAPLALLVRGLPS